MPIRRSWRTTAPPFRAAIDPLAGRFVEPFLTAPSPGILATIVQNEHYDTFDNYLAALGAALKVEYDAIARAGFLLQLDCPDLALERHTWFRDRPLGDFLDFVERVVATINRAIADIPREQVRLHVCWGNYEAPHDRDVPVRDNLPIILKARSAASSCRSPIRATPMNIACSRRCRRPTTRSSLPA